MMDLKKSLNKFLVYLSAPCYNHNMILYLGTLLGIFRPLQYRIFQDRFYSQV